MTAGRVPAQRAYRRLVNEQRRSVFVHRRLRSAIAHVVELSGRTAAPFTERWILRAELRPCCGSRGKRWYIADPTDDRVVLCGRCARVLAARGIDLAPDTAETFATLAAEIDQAADMATLTRLRGRVVAHPAVARLSSLFGARRQVIWRESLRLEPAAAAALMDPKESLCLPR